MNQRRNILKLMLGGVVSFASTSSWATGEIEVYHSPD